MIQLCVLLIINMGVFIHEVPTVRGVGLQGEVPVGDVGLCRGACSEWTGVRMALGTSNCLQQLDLILTLPLAQSYVFYVLYPCIILIIFHVILMIFEVDNISPKTLWEKYEESIVYDMLLKLL